MQGSLQQLTATGVFEVETSNLSQESQETCMSMHFSHCAQYTPTSQIWTL